MAAVGGIAGRAGRRFLSSVPALLGVLVFTFLLMRVLPGDPAVFFASGPNAGQAEIDALREQMGLDKPVPQQLALYLRDVATGNLGRSMTTGQPVLTDLRSRLPASLELTFAALALALALALPLGIAAALARDSPLDHGVRLKRAQEYLDLSEDLDRLSSGISALGKLRRGLDAAPDATSVG